MKIERNIKVKDRKSLADLEKHLLKKRDISRQLVKENYDVIKDKWSPKHLAEDFLRNSAVPYVVHGIFNIAKSFGEVKTNTRKEEWFNLIESFVEAFVRKKAEEITRS